MTNYNSYTKFFSRESFWNKIEKAAKAAGIKVIYAALLLYYVATDPNTPMADKAKIYGALGYFIAPLDLIPDCFPPMGYTDDFAALYWALKTVYANITPEIREKAQNKLREWFGTVSEEDLSLIKY